MEALRKIKKCKNYNSNNNQRQQQHDCLTNNQLDFINNVENQQQSQHSVAFVNLSRMEIMTIMDNDHKINSSRNSSSSDISSSSNNSENSEINNIIRLYQQPWFHGSISRTECEKLILENCEFLVRLSSNNNPNNNNNQKNSLLAMDTKLEFVLSCMVDGFVHHILLKDQHGQIRNQFGITFESIVNLIQYHHTIGIPILSINGVKLYLKKPVFRKNMDRLKIH